jgi:hypothetical protein
MTAAQLDRLVDDLVRVVEVEIGPVNLTARIEIERAAHQIADEAFYAGDCHFGESGPPASEKVAA